LIFNGNSIKDTFFSESGKLDLYRMVFPISLPHDTLAVIGTHRNFGPSAPTFELQSRLVARVMAGRHKLPSRDAMKGDVDRENKETFRLSGGYKYQVCELWLEEIFCYLLLY
jgi:hypothetical protein